MSFCPFRDNHRCEDCMLYNLNTRRCAFVSMALAQEQLVVLRETANRAAASRIAASEAFEPEKPASLRCKYADKTHLCDMCHLKDWDTGIDDWGLCPGWDHCDIPSRREKL